MAEYPKKYIHIHIPEKDMRKKNSQDNLVPANVKETQIFNNYIKELSIGNKKTPTTIIENSLVW